ncbi:MAG: AbrB family transcriptional regulator [Hyphomicrobiales bacterium]
MARLPPFDRVKLRSLAIAMAGGMALGLAGIPGGWIAGSMLAVAITALSGVEVDLSPTVRNLGFLAVGISMGSGVTPETIARLPSWPITIVLVILSIPMIAGVLTLFLMRVARWDLATALLSSMPGALSYLIALAPETKADVPRVAILQTTRVAILVAVLPLAALWLSEPVPPAAFVPLGGLDDAILLYGAGVGGAVLAFLVRVPAGLLVGGLFISAILHGSGLVVGRPPEWIAVTGFIILGTLIGTRFAGTHWRDLGKVLGVSLASFVLGSSIAVAMALIGSALTGFSVLKLIIAFAPGGLEAMVVLAFAMDLDPAFVAAHHLVRFLLIALAAPFVVHGFKLGAPKT